MENVALWHERDISHSSVERMIGPDATITLDFALARLTGVIDKLVVYPENMLKNLNKFRGLVHSQRVLLALTQAGVSREDSYRLVQRNAMKVWEQGADFLEELLADTEVPAALPEEEIREKFDLGYHTKHVDTIFRRVFRRGLSRNPFPSPRVTGRMRRAAPMSNHAFPGQRPDHRAPRVLTAALAGHIVGTHLDPGRAPTGSDHGGRRRGLCQAFAPIWW